VTFFIKFLGSHKFIEDWFLLKLLFSNVTKEIGPIFLRFYGIFVCFYLSVKGFIFVLLFWVNSEIELLLLDITEDLILQFDLTLDFIIVELSRFYLLLELRVTLNFTLLAKPR
jgi:hypothetical protein